MKDKILRWVPFVLLFFPFKIFSFFYGSKNVYLFGTGTGYFHDNPKYLFLEFLKEKEIGKVLWVAKTNKIYHELRRRGYPVIKRNSLIAAYYTAVAKAFIVSAELFDVSYFINDHTKLVQLWHGTPVKHIGLDNENDKRRNNRKGKWLGKNYTYNRFDLFSVDEKEYVPIFMSAFGCFKNKVKVLGQPRNKIWSDNELKQKISKEIDALSYDKVILYAPTYRDTSIENINLLNNLIKEIKIENLKKQNAFLLIKLHPFLTNGTIDFPREVINFENVKDVSDYTDFQELLLISDCLITDLSSCVLDYKYSGKPFFSFFPDKEKYIEGRDGVYETNKYLEENTSSFQSLFQFNNNCLSTESKNNINQLLKEIC